MSGLTPQPVDWYAVAVAITGRLVSVGTVVGDDLPPEYVVLDLEGEPDLSEVMWDEYTKTFVDRPDPDVGDRLLDFLADGNWPSLDMGNRAKVVEVVERLLPEWARYY